MENFQGQSKVFIKRSFRHFLIPKGSVAQDFIFVAGDKGDTTGESAPEVRMETFLNMAVRNGCLLKKAARA
jgi:hypothetical protein